MVRRSAARLLRRLGAGRRLHLAPPGGVYFKLFGSVYLFDGVLGRHRLRLPRRRHLHQRLPLLNDIEFPARFFANLPHLVIGGFAVYVGFWLSKRVYDHFATA